MNLSSHFFRQYLKKIRPWIIENSQQKPKGDFIKIKCRNKNIGEKKKSRSITINLSKDFYNVDKNNIIGVFLTQ